MTPLEKLLKDRIRESGPIDVGTYMAEALGHPEYGYYMTRDPFGRSGDFTTAPEVSQMFGELLGAWCADVWIKLGQPEKIQLVECGPGRGTLMVDLLRGTKAIPGFHDSLQIVCVETSPVLREKQQNALAGHNVSWCENLNDPLLQNGQEPLLFLANELLDALPARQLVFHKGQWRERMIELNNEGDFIFRPSPYEIKMPVPVQGQEMDVFEFSPARENFVGQVADLLKQRTGAALFIDYGHAKPATGDTLQAIKGHEYAPVFKDVGEADLTSHVDFSALVRCAKDKKVSVAGVATQGVFLQNLGIAMRAEALMRGHETAQKEDVIKALHRLTAPDQMGTLFKVMGLCHDDNLGLSGF